MKQEEVPFPDATESQMALEKSEKVEDLSDYEEALSNVHHFSELDLKPSIES